MSDDLTPAAAIRTAVFSPGQATPAPATSALPAPTAPPPLVPGPPQGGITSAQSAQMIEWEKENLAQGKITPEEAAKRFDSLGATPEQRAPDTRSDDVKQLDRDFPPAKESDFIIPPYYPPGQAPPTMPKELQQFDSAARKWMAAMGLSRDQGNNMARLIARAIQQTHRLSAGERESHKENENVRLDRLFGPGWDDRLAPANRMIREVNDRHPGFTEFARAHTDNAELVLELIKAARIYDKRKGR